MSAPTPAAGTQKPRVFTVELPTGLVLLNANDRLHWAVRARRVREIRDAARWMARHNKVPRLARARIDVVVHPKPRASRFDPHNWGPSAKAAIDGLVDAGVLPDDSSAYLVASEVRAGDPVRGGRLDLVITEVFRDDQ
ncbi:hypothetical protein ABTX81_30360 [Kitasatospora sp. NPDC097605]|uniref:hypothetical protein n=1 Tax=Kitasatospora sp. NPDC097605 TaxID=3157226 RepID=UPI0033238107